MRERGMPLARWAREHGYRLAAVYRVMGGQYKGYFGKAHEIAVALGLKLPADESSETLTEGNTRSKAAA